MFKRCFVYLLSFLLTASTLSYSMKVDFNSIPVHKMTGYSNWIVSEEPPPIHRPTQGNERTYTFDTIEIIRDRYELHKPVKEVITTRLPSLLASDPDYISFRKDIASLIELADKASGIDTSYGVFVMDLATSYYCGVNENLTREDPESRSQEGYFNSASVIKLFQGYILCDMMRQGELSKDGTYYDAVTGRKFKLLKMLSHMISYSDNNYSNATLRLVGRQKSNEVLERLGLFGNRIYGEMNGAIGYSKKNNMERYGTSRRCARITPQGAGLILYNVYQSKDTDLYMKTMNEALLGNIYNTRIPVGVHRVSKNYAVAHKTGTNSEYGVYNDAGIVYCRNPFILVSFTQGTSCSTGEAFTRKLAKDLTHYFDSKAMP